MGLIAIATKYVLRLKNCPSNDLNEWLINLPIDVFFHCQSENEDIVEQFL